MYCVEVLTRAEAQFSDKNWITGTKSVAELRDEGFQIFSSFLWCMDVSEEIPQSIGEELVTEIMEGHQLIQDIPPAHTQTHKLIPNGKIKATIFNFV